MKLIAQKYWGEILLLLSSLSFSFEWLFTRKLYAQGFSALDITLGRSFFTMLIIGLFFPLVIKNFFTFKNIRKKDFLYITIISLAVIFAATFFNLAINYTTVANTLIIFYLCIFWGILFGFLFLGEQSSKKKLLYTLLAFLGICLALLKDRQGLALSIGAGELLALASSFFFSFDAIASRKIKHTNIFQRMFLIYLIMSILIFLFTATTKNITYFTTFLNFDFFLYAFALAFTCGFLGKGLFYLGVNKVPVSIALVIMLAEPITQMTTAYLFANEKLLVINIIGIIIVFAMIILISKKENCVIETEELR